LIARKDKVDIIAVSVGFDRHEQDWSGVLKTEDYRTICKMIKEFAERVCNETRYGILESGYNNSVLGKNIKALLEGMTQHHKDIFGIIALIYNAGCCSAMPTNLPPTAKKKWNEVTNAQTPQEKLAKLQEFLSLVPRHKGTARLLVQTKRQIKTLQTEIEEKKRRRTGRSGPRFFFEKEGAAQIVVLGPTKVGRSSLLASITNAKVEISDYLYTTREPIPGMFQYEDIQFQIVEAPALVEGAAEGELWGLQTLGLARNADGILLMVDLSDNAPEQLALILSEMDKARILAQKPSARVEIERKHIGAGLRIMVIGRLVNCNLRDVEDLLKGYRIIDAVVRIYGEASLDDVEDAVFESTTYRPSIIVANKTDAPKASQGLKKLEMLVGNQISIVPISCRTMEGVGRLGPEIFNALEIIRVYSKEPSKRQPSPRPFILKKGSSITDLAKQVHSDFIERFAYARVWSKRLPFSPQKVGSAFFLEDGDVVELHAK
jgi:ribosome-interacting GTPase 1